MSLFITVISCEKDFTDIGSNVISNTKFDTKSETIEIIAENSAIEKIVSDNNTKELAQYLLGVYANTNYEKIEASIVSQIGISTGLMTIETDTLTKYNTGTTSINTSIDTVFIKLPYQSTFEETSSAGPVYSLDSIIGDQSEAFDLNIYQLDTYLNSLDPTDPSKANTYYSDFDFQTIGSELNATKDFKFIPNPKDTVMYVKRRTSNNILVTTDTVKYVATANGTIPVPFASIPLNESKFKSLFLDKFESSEFSSQDAFNDYFRGIILKATGTKGSLISFNLNNAERTELNPSIEVYYTNTVLNNATGDTIKTFQKNHSFSLSGVRANPLKMENKMYSNTGNEVKLQGTAGNEVSINLFGADLDNNGVADKLEELRSKNWLINDATLTFYINQSIDIESVPYRLYMYKDYQGSNPVSSQIDDAITEAGFGGIRGFLTLDENDNKEKYTFKVTDYVSNLLSGETSYSPTLKLRVFNITDLPTSPQDTLFNNNRWNPKAVTLFNHSITNGEKRAQLKISYSEKKE